jgi:protein O-mannosyl-transferase
MNRLIGLRTRTVVIIFALVGLGVYANMLGNHFVDDDIQLDINPAFHSPVNIPGFFIKGDRSYLTGGYYRPLADAFFTIEYTFFGNQPFYYHGVQLILHILTSILIYLLYKKYFPHTISMILGLIFLIHPLNTEAVAYISAFREILFLVFGLMSIHVIFSKLKGNKRYVLLFGLSLASILAKETGVIFLILTPLADYLAHKKRIKGVVSTQICVAGSYLLLRAGSGINLAKKAIVPIQLLDLPHRLIQDPKIVFYYIKNFIYPLNLLSNQAWVIKNLSVTNFYLPLGVDILFLLIAGALLYFSVSKEKNLYTTMAFFGVWFLVALGVHLQFIPLDVTVADRWFYAPMVGLLGLIGVIVGQMKKYIVVPTIIILIIMSVVTINRNTDWKTGLILTGRDLAKSHQEDYLLEKRFGTELMINSQYDQAIVHLTNANRIFPTNFGVWNNLGNIYLKTGKIDKAQIAYEQSIKNDNYYGAYENLVYLYLKYKSIPEAKSFIDKSLAVYSNDPQLWYYELIIELKLNHHPEALAAAKRYYQLRPNEQSYIIYGRLLEGQPVTITLN